MNNFELTFETERKLTHYIIDMFENKQIFFDDIVINIIQYAVETYEDDIDKQICFIQSITGIDEDELIKILKG